MAGFDDVASAIINGQKAVMGPVAISLAQKVPGIVVDADGAATISGDGAGAIESLVKEYSSLTGQLGVRMCFQSARQALAANPDVRIPSFAGM
jgi:hypothetical protein